MFYRRSRFIMGVLCAGAVCWATPAKDSLVAGAVSVAVTLIVVSVWDRLDGTDKDST
jgi:hypothetical protein